MQRLFVSFQDWSSRSGGSVDGEGTDCLNFANTLKQPSHNPPIQEKEGSEEDGCLSYTTLQPAEPLLPVLRPAQPLVQPTLQQPRPIFPSIQSILQVTPVHYLGYIALTQSETKTELRLSGDGEGEHWKV